MRPQEEVLSKTGKGGAWGMGIIYGFGKVQCSDISKKPKRER